MRQHTNALKALLEGAPALAGKVHVTLATGAGGALSLPYVVIHPSDGTDAADRFTGPKQVFNPRFTLHSVGADANQAAATAEAVKRCLIVNGFGVSPTVPGENSKRLWYSVPMPLQVDRDVSPPLVFHVAECGFESSPQ